MATSEPSLGVQPVVSGEEIIRARRVVNTIYVDDKIKDYIVSLVLATAIRRPPAGPQRLHPGRRFATRHH